MLFDRYIEPSCAYCRHGVYLGQNEIACVKRGIVSLSGLCNKFLYEPTKRTPYVKGKLTSSGLSKEDFEL